MTATSSEVGLLGQQGAALGGMWKFLKKQLQNLLFSTSSSQVLKFTGILTFLALVNLLRPPRVLQNFPPSPGTLGSSTAFFGKFQRPLRRPLRNLPEMESACSIFDDKY